MKEAFLAFSPLLIIVVFILLYSIYQRSRED